MLFDHYGVRQYEFFLEKICSWIWFDESYATFNPKCATLGLHETEVHIYCLRIESTITYLRMSCSKIKISIHNCCKSWNQNHLNSLFRKIAFGNNGSGLLLALEN
ncbi:hypothetical protein O6H91_08G109800 [Diphasiastrum complanatum]|uniref:Uncharacterized protein n=2 Tax=Diphasiastrum complanatum TaxID=34168 RepID=A0ACC2D0Y7_DIPCM|nr:hypothetical protein O6H91_08G021800 [Diphasiastrum complanatum]KAJ7547921.1 hypothetical protein O6H91_08G109800 [Diphasiastrum complanatum]